jgi:hypothetical protein
MHHAQFQVIFQNAAYFENDSPSLYTMSSSSTISVSETVQENMQVLRNFKSNQDGVPISDVLKAVKVLCRLLSDERNLKAVKVLCRLLSDERNLPVDLIIDAGALPFFVAFLTNDAYPELQFMAAWALTNVASTSRTKDVANCPNAVPSLVRLLYSSSNDVREQAVCCIGNIAGDSVSFRDGLVQTERLIEGM